MLGIIMWIIVLAGAAGMVAKGIKDSDEYFDYEDYEHEDHGYRNDDEEEEQITILRHYPDGTVEIQQ